MKKILFLTALAFVVSNSYAQRIKEKDLLGTWDLVLNVEEAIEKEADDSDTMMEKVLINVISGFVGGIIDDIDISFEFKSSNRLKIVVSAYGETETEYGKWRINSRGNLEIDDIEDEDNRLNFNSDDDEWVLLNGLLVPEDEKDDRTVYMKKRG